MDDLHYVSGDIRKIENEAKQAYLELVSQVSMRTVLLFVKHGLHVNDEKAEQAVDAYLAEGENDITTLFADVIIKALSKAGFLPKALQTKVKEEMSKKMEEVSPKSGKA
jgi:hypothetical protein